MEKEREESWPAAQGGEGEDEEEEDINVW